VGVLLGVGIGDALGAQAPLLTGENLSIKENFSYLSHMTMALVTTLVPNNCFNANNVSYQYAEIYHKEPERKYPQYLKQILTSIYEKRSNYMTSGQSQISKSNDCAIIRVIPLGLAFRNASELVFLESIKAALLCTHTEKEVIDLSYIQGKAICEISKLSSSTEFLPDKWLKNLANYATTPTLRDKLLIIIVLLEKLQQKPHVVDKNFTKFLTVPQNPQLYEPILNAFFGIFQDIIIIQNKV